jgi:outer membrane protein assembly factor BamB
MKLSLSIGVYFIFFCLLACTKSKNEHDDQNAGKSDNLTQFVVKVLERTPETALIQWDSSLNKLNTGQVKYRVILDGNMVEDNLTRLTDTLFNLQKNKTYAGKVVAYLSTGESTFSEFNLSTYEGFLYAYTNDRSGLSRFGCFNAYPVSNAPVQPSIWRNNTGDVRTPTLSNDTMFLVVDNKLQAVNANTGINIWQGPANISFITTATYARGKLYACASTGELVCLNSSNGQVLWTFRSANTYVNLNSVPVCDNNKVFVAVTNFTNAEMNAVDAVTGQKIWTYNFRTTICQRPVAAKGVVVFSSGWHGQVFAVDQNTGDLKWTKKDLATVGEDQFNPIPVDDKVLVHTSGALYALNLQTGNEDWIHYNFTRLTHCVTGNGMIYFCKDSSTYIYQGTDRSYIKCISAKDGHEIWRQGGRAEEHHSQLVFGKDKIYSVYISRLRGGSDLETTPRIVAYNATTGKPDNNFTNFNPVSANRYESVYTFCVKRDGVVYYPSSHGNYQ